MKTPNLPAVIIGGPPHSGKSVLVYSLTKGLRARKIDHYVLRACPDGEGDFSNESDQELVRTIRQKGSFTDDFTALVASHLAKRHLPLLVDVGGRPTPDQEAMFGLCTHAILLVGEQPGDGTKYHADREVWQQIMRRAGVAIIADMKSVLSGQDRLVDGGMTLLGTITGLERGKTVSGPVVEALLDRLEGLFAPLRDEITSLHRASAPTAAHFIDLHTLAQALGSDQGHWRPEQLAVLQENVPKGEALAAYGRAPNWVYAHLALQALPEDIYHYDARYGWLSPPRLPPAGTELAEAQYGWQPELVRTNGYLILELLTSSQYLDPEEPGRLPLPAVEESLGLVLSGKVPNWLLLAAARQLGIERPWLAIYQPQLNGAVVVCCNDNTRAVGELIPITKA